MYGHGSLKRRRQGAGVAAGAVTTLDPAKKGPDIVLSLGNLRAVVSAAGWETVLGTVSHPAANPTGYYFEATATVISSFARAGIATAAANVTGVYFVQTDANSQGASSDNTTGFGTAFVAGDVLGFYVKNSTIWFRKNGVWTGDPVGGTGGTPITIGANVFPAVSGLPATGQWDVNFGATAFAGAIPAGGASWNSA